MERNQAREKRHSMSTPETLAQRRPCVQHNNRRPMGAERVVDTQHGTRLSPNQQETLSEGSRMQSHIRTDAQQRTRRSQSKAATRIESLSMESHIHIRTEGITRSQTRGTRPSTRRHTSSHNQRTPSHHLAVEETEIAEAPGKEHSHMMTKRGGSRPGGDTGGTQIRRESAQIRSILGGHPVHTLKQGMEPGKRSTTRPAGVSSDAATLQLRSKRPHPNLRVGTTMHRPFAHSLPGERSGGEKGANGGRSGECGGGKERNSGGRKRKQST
jgi:hypothetical protein